jgi:hypothetical protein
MPPSLFAQDHYDPYTMSLKNFLRNGNISTFVSIDHPPAPQELDYTNWLLFPSLLGGSYPFPQDLKILNDLGFNYIIDLTQEPSQEPFFQNRKTYADKTKTKVEAFSNITIKKFPIPDVNVPDDKTKTYYFCRDIYDLLIAGKKIYLHCIGGRGRTSIIAGVILYFYQFSYDEVLSWLNASYMSRRNKGKFGQVKVPESDSQFKFLKDMYDNFYF